METRLLSPTKTSINYIRNKQCELGKTRNKWIFEISLDNFFSLIEDGYENGELQGTFYLNPKTHPISLLRKGEIEFEDNSDCLDETNFSKYEPGPGDEVILKSRKAIFIENNLTIYGVGKDYNLDTLEKRSLVYFEDNKEILFTTSKDFKLSRKAVWSAEQISALWSERYLFNLVEFRDISGPFVAYKYKTGAYNSQIVQDFTINKLSVPIFEPGKILYIRQKDRVILVNCRTDIIQMIGFGDQLYERVRPYVYAYEQQFDFHNTKSGAFEMTCQQDFVFLGLLMNSDKYLQYKSQVYKENFFRDWRFDELFRY